MALISQHGRTGTKQVETTLLDVSIILGNGILSCQYFINFILYISIEFIFSSNYELLLVYHFI